MSVTSLASLNLDLDVFQGPFDLLLTLILNEEIDLLEVDLAGIVLAYVEHLQGSERLDLEAATEFLVLIAALLELKSRLMLPVEGDDEGLDLEPAAAAEELLARMLEYKRFRAVAEQLIERRAAELGFGYRQAPLPAHFKQVSLEAATQAYQPVILAEAVSALLRPPPKLNLAHLQRPSVSLQQRLDHLRLLMRTRASFSFDDAVQGVDRMTEAVTLFAVLELYKKGELSWQQNGTFEPITLTASSLERRLEQPQRAG